LPTVPHAKKASRVFSNKTKGLIVALFLMSEAKSGILHETLLKVKLAEDGAAT
jgi:hypothetical protein